MKNDQPYPEKFCKDFITARAFECARASQTGRMLLLTVIKFQGTGYPIIPVLGFLRCLCVWCIALC